jgi:hypothetical protein
LPDFLGATYQKRGKFTKMGVGNIPNGHKIPIPNGNKIYQMAVK